MLKPNLLIAFVFITLCSFANKPKKSKVKITQTQVTAPFAMPNIKVPNFNKLKTINIKEYGAVENDKEKNYIAIHKAIDKANSLGGATVIIPAGTWLTKKIHLKSNVNLHLEKNAELLFSENPEDYLPAVFTTWEGMECYNYSPLIYAYNCENIAITGQGKLKAKLDIWKIWYKRPAEHIEGLKDLYHAAAKNTPVENRNMVKSNYNFRPQFIQFNRCKNVLLENVSIVNSPFWVIHPYLSTDVTVRKINVYAHGHNNDGVDPEMTQNMLIEDCVFDQGDDAIAIKAGRNQDAWRLNTPSKNIVIRNCLVKNGHQLLAIGSEMSGGVENIFMDNCEVVDGAKLNHLLFLKTNERRGGYIKNIYFNNIKSGKIDKGILGIETNVLYQWKDIVPTYQVKLTPIHDIYLKNVTATNVDFVSRVLGQKEMPIKNITLDNVKANNIRNKESIHENLEGFISK